MNHNAMQDRAEIIRAVAIRRYPHLRWYVEADGESAKITASASVSMPIDDRHLASLDETLATVAASLRRVLPERST